MTVFKRIEQAIAAVKAGKMIILTDHPDRENEGDLVISAELITPASMNFMIRNGTGIVCLPMAKEMLDKLQLPMMVSDGFNHSSPPFTAAFTISIDAKNNATGVSAYDRVMTINAAIADHATREDFVSPGHMFPLRARDGGVLERPGHTEGSIDLMRLANLKPAAVLCEIMNPDGTMTKGKQLEQFAQAHNIVMISINDLIEYRLCFENQILDLASTILPTEEYGMLELTVLKEKYTKIEHMLIKKMSSSLHAPILIRIHSSCTTGDLFGSKRCDCYDELHYSLKRISKEGGLLIYLNQEGRGIGLLNKIKAYHLQEKGLDTVEANEQLGLPVDSRHYYIAANILRNEGITHIKLLTNNLKKVADLEQCGIVVTREGIPAFQNEHNINYLKTKIEKLNHSLTLNGHLL